MDTETQQTQTTIEEQEVQATDATVNQDVVSEQAENKNEAAENANAKPNTEAGKDADGAPEKYEFANTEGMSYDDEALGKLDEAFRGLNLPNDKANSLIETVRAAEKSAEQRRIVDVRKSWEEAFHKDPEIGGAKADETLSFAVKGRDAVPESIKDSLGHLLDDTGFGSHPDIIRLFSWLGRITSDGNMVGGRSGSAPKTIGERLYGAD